MAANAEAAAPRLAELVDRPRSVRLEAASGLQTGLRTEGTLAVAYDSGDLAALDRLTEFRHSIGLKAERLDAHQAAGA